jgi:hypothetical protein
MLCRGLAHVKTGRRILIDIQDLDDLIDSKKQQSVCSGG